jgi:hypothetical protein
MINANFSLTSKSKDISTKTHYYMTTSLLTTITIVDSSEEKKAKWTKSTTQPTI